MEQTISRMESSSSTTSICSPTMGMQVLGKKLIITSFQSNGNGECLNFGNPKRDATILLNGQLSALFLIARTIWLPQGETMTSGLLMNQASFGAVDSIWEALPRPARYYREIYEQNQHRIYSICFLMTGNELEAEELTHNVFHRTFRNLPAADVAALDAALVSELRDSRPIGNLTLQCGAAEEVLNVRRSARLDDLEQAVLQLPATERMIYLLHDR